MKKNSQNIRDNTSSASANIKIAFVLNISFTIVEFFGGILTNSVAIISSAVHDLGDSLSLGLAWYFQEISLKKSDKIYSFGYKRFSLLGAIINSLVLIIASILVLSETIPRLFNPKLPNIRGMIILALLGFIVNGIAVLRLKKGSSINEKVVSLHLLEDVLGWGAILLASIIMLFAYIPVLDPVLSVLITLYVLHNVFKNLKTSTRIFLQAAPTDVDLKSIKDNILILPGVSTIHDIHIWTLDGIYNILSIHLVLKINVQSHEIKKLKEKVKNVIKDQKIHHLTIETEWENEGCELKECGS